MIKKEINTYSSIGRLIQQDVFGSDDKLAYTLRWDYDEMGNITLETDALGQEIHRRYDANGNLVFEQGPSHDFYRAWAYDFMNRMIRSEEVYPDRTLTVHCSYDLLGNRVSETDIYGNATHFTYDSGGHLCRTTSPSVPHENGSFGPVITKKEYNILGKPTAVINGAGHEIY